jgi:hypothetical protein
MKLSFCKSQLAFFSKIESDYAMKPVAISSDPLEFQKLKDDAGSTPHRLLPYI